ncbi:MAG: SAM-dependent methyltransferase [Ferruginibacter sp.]
MSTVYLIPSLLAEDAIETIPAYILPAVKECQVMFVENERTARRFLKQLDKNIVIDDFRWYPIHKAEEEQLIEFRNCLKQDLSIGIISEAGCPGVADPGQILIAAAQDAGARIKPLVGPSSILLSLMASGMNGQQFEFIGYLPVDTAARVKKIRELELLSAKQNSTKIFIETPYRNNQLLDSLLEHVSPGTRLCIAVDITGKSESIRTKTISDWKKNKPSLHKIPVIFLLQAGS